MPVIPYLFFGGNCAEAMRFYEKTFGGKLELMMTYGQSPEGCPDTASPDKIMHAHLVLDGGSIMASDDMSGTQYRGMSGYAVSLDFPSAEQARGVFDALAEGGQVWMPMGKTFWSEAFGMVADRFGAGWMISVATPQQ